MIPKRIQLKRTKGWRKPPNTIVVSRPTKWGNPFNWQDCDPSLPDSEKKRLATLDYYHWLTKPEWKVYYPEQRQWILDHIHELKDHNLACWCKLCDKHKDGKPLNEDCPDCEPCHVDPLGKLANGYE